ncbi:MAG: hypothetical protein J3Q66DRAFT_321123 [Benniella sp.]|nr:MAG: hypothetical protein J3Q66DRAFT_321123 [Benniella sp.]
MTLSPALTRPLQRCTLDSIRRLGHHTGPPPLPPPPLQRWRGITLFEQNCQHFRPRSYATGKVLTKSVTQENKQRPMKTTTRSREGRLWSEELDTLLLTLRKANKTWDYISMATGRSSSACTDRYYTSVDPALREWTPAMFVKLEQMVGQGARWSEISEALKSNVISCQHQWRMFGRGKYRLNSTMGMVQALDWTSGEVNTFWTAWLQHGTTDWGAISDDVASKSASECRDSFRLLTINALKDAPGWLRIETSKYLAAATRSARSRQQALASKPASKHEATEWTAAEHKALLKAVEEHGLFSGWDNIRSLVKPESSEDEVEAEYYKLSGVSLDNYLESDEDRKAKLRALDGEWTADQVKTLNAILMRYSTLPVWTREASKRGISASDNDSETYLKLLRDNSESHGEGAPSLLGWNQERTDRLKRLVKQQQQQETTSGQPVNWAWIAEHIGPGFDAGACITWWQSLPAESKAKLDASQYWDDRDVDLLKQGMIAHGKCWSLIHKHYLPGRSVESIRRKVSNVQRRRDVLIEETKTRAIRLRVTNPDLDVDDFVHRTIKDNPICLLAKEIDELNLPPMKGTKCRTRLRDKMMAAIGDSNPSSQKVEDTVVEKIPSPSPSPSSSLPSPSPPPKRPRGRPRKIL